MGGAGLPGLIFAVVLLALIALSVLVFVPWFKSQREHVDRLSSSDVETLEYEVPEGQDPAVVVDALKRDGLDAVGQFRHGRQLVLIDATGGADRVRPRARAVIAHQAPLNPEDDVSPDVQVRFLDEAP
jgi:hypothetical protein